MAERAQDLVIMRPDGATVLRPRTRTTRGDEHRGDEGGLKLGNGMVAGGEFAQLGYGGWNDFERSGDLLRRGVAAEAEANAGARFSWRQADGGEDVGRFDGAGRAGCAGGAGETF